MKFLSAICACFALFLVLLSSPASAQIGASGQQDKFGRSPQMEQELKDKEKDTKEIEKEYNAVVKRTGGSQNTSTSSYDPWQTIRPSISSKPKN